MINKRDYLVNTQVGSVYSYNELSLQGLLNKFYEEIGKALADSEQAMEFMKWMKEEGLPQEVQKELTEMYEDGRLQGLINDVLLAEIKDISGAWLDAYKEESDPDYTNAFSKMFTEGITTVNLKPNKIYTIKQVQLPNRPITIKGNYSQLNYNGVLPNVDVYFKSGGPLSRLNVYSVIFDGSNIDRISDCLNTNNLVAQSVSLINNRESTKGIVDIANFSGQGLDSNRIGFILHHYTDSEMVRLDNVGNGVVLHLKNARNPNRRKDKENGYCGTGDFARFSQSEMVDGEEVVNKVYEFKNNGVQNFYKSIVDFVNHSVNTTFLWGFRFKNMIKKTAVFCIDNGGDLFQLTYNETDDAYTNEIPNKSFIRKISKPFRTRISNNVDGQYGVTVENIGVSNRAFSVLQGNKEILNVNKDSVDLASLDLVPQTVAPTPKKGGMYYNANLSKFLFCEDGIEWKIIDMTTITMRNYSMEDYSQL